MRALNVGSGGEGAPMPGIYEGWEIVRLDLDPTAQPDLLMDVRDISTLAPEQFDAVYSSHNLEHLYRHDLRAVIHGMWHVLNDGGFVDIIVPNVGKVLAEVVAQGLDLDSFLYQTPGGPICVRDVLWGYSKFCEYSQRPELYLHRNGFSKHTLGMLLMHSGFSSVVVVGAEWDLRVIGFKQPASDRRLLELGLVVDRD